MTKDRACTIAVAPGTVHLGFAVFRGPDLIQFGVKTLPGKRSGKRLIREAKKYLDTLSNRLRTTKLVVEEPFYAQAQRSSAVRNLTNEIRRWGRRKRLAVRSVTPRYVKISFCGGKGTRRSLAEAMATRFPFLQPYLKPLRTQRARAYWLQMFDAVALGALQSQTSNSRDVEL